MWAKSGPLPPSTLRNRLTFEAVAVCGCIDMEGRLAHMEIRPKSFNQYSFKDFLVGLREKVPAEKTVFVLVDNLGVHRTKLVRDYCTEAKIELIFNGAYSSEFHPQERCWLYAKRAFQRRLITVYNFKNKRLIQNLVKECMESVPAEGLKAYVTRCLRKMRDWL